MKTALDISDVEGSFAGEGMYGEFYTNYNQEEKQKLKQKLGRIPDNVGIKKYTYPKADLRINAAENLAVIYIAPYIRQQTSFKTPEFTGNLSLAGMIGNGFIVSQKMPGVNIFTELGRGDLGEKAAAVSRASIEKKLSGIGVINYDMHGNNFFVKPEKIKIIKEQYEEGEPIEYDLSEGASLFDFGFMKVKKGTPPGQKLQQLKEKLIATSDSKLFKTIIRVIEDMLV
jgi:hypothetical protein